MDVQSTVIFSILTNRKSFRALDNMISVSKPLRVWCSDHRCWRSWTLVTLSKASIQAHMLPSPPSLVAPCLLPSALGVPLFSPTPSGRWYGYPTTSLASVNTTCCQVLATNGLLCRSLDHLNASPHHMLGCVDLDLLSGSPRSPPGDPPPLRLPSPK